MLFIKPSTLLWMVIPMITPHPLPTLEQAQDAIRSPPCPPLPLPKQMVNRAPPPLLLLLRQQQHRQLHLPTSRKASSQPKIQKGPTSRTTGILGQLHWHFPTQPPSPTLSLILARPTTAAHTTSPPNSSSSTPMIFRPAWSMMRSQGSLPPRESSLSIL